MAALPSEVSNARRREHLIPSSTQRSPTTIIPPPELLKQCPPDFILSEGHLLQTLLQGLQDIRLQLCTE